MDTSVTSRELIHNFAAVVARVAAGEDLVVTRHGKPIVKIIRPETAEDTSTEREALLQKALAFKMNQNFGHAGKFVRDEAYDD